VKLLITEGANVNTKDDKGWSPLHTATGEGKKEVVQLLITKGAKVNAKTNSGFTSLDVAFYVTNQEISDILLKHGAKTGKLKVAIKPNASQAQ